MRLRIFSLSNGRVVRSQGTGFVIANSIEQLRSRGHTVSVLQPDEYEVLQWLRPRANSYRQAIGMALAVLRVLCGKTRVDVFEFYGGTAWLATLLVKWFRPAAFVVQHSNGPEMRAPAAVVKQMRWFQVDQRSLFSRAFTSADLVITVSESDRQWLVTQGIKKLSDVICIPPAIDDVFRGSTAAISNRLRRIGFCGNWSTIKGVDILMEDMKRVLLDYPDTEFALLGPGSLDKHALFGRQLAERVTCHPWIDDKVRVRAFFESVAIYVQPSHYESFGLAIVEAMASGCAVVSTRVGVTASLQHKAEVYHLPEAKSPHLYQAVSALLNDEPLRASIAEAGRQYSRRWSWEEAGQRHSDCLVSRVLSRGSSHRAQSLESTH
jgi:glycosyltransferase involved in cell wall biosynthesis